MATELGCSSEDISLPDGKLPGDLMVSILCNLSVKPLLKFKSVSKRWYSCISSPNFIKRHLPRHSLIPNTLVMTLGDYGYIDFGFLPHNRDKDNASSQSDVVFLESRTLFSLYDNSLNIIDSCYGLVCLYARSRGLTLWNPATRKHRSLGLPAPDYCLSHFSLGLCYVESTNDFKIMGWTDVHNPGNRQYLFVYSLSLDSWEKSDYDARDVSVQKQNPSFMNGCMHWLAKRSSCTCSVSCTCASLNVIMAFDVLDGVMSFFGVPDNGAEYTELVEHTLVIRGCLSVVIFPGWLTDDFDIWVMEEYGVERSWVKRFIFQGNTPIHAPLIPLNDGKFVFTSPQENSNVLTFYGPSSKEKRRLAFKSFYVYQAYNYVASLASVGMMAENAPF